MQATKQRPTSGKKGANKSGDNRNGGKSVAQRVMDVSSCVTPTGNSGSINGSQSTSNNDISHQATVATTTTATNQMRPSCSFENDQEVENITSRALKQEPELKKIAPPVEQSTKSTEANSPPLLLNQDPLPATNGQCLSPSHGIEQPFDPSDAGINIDTKSQRPVLATTSSQILNIDPSEDRFRVAGDGGGGITLDTKVPHPMKSNKFQEEEVSYYNEQPAPPPTTKSVTMEKKASISDDIKSCTFGISTSMNQQYRRHQQMHEANSREYINDVLDEEIYERRYDNAGVIERASQEKLYRSEGHINTSGPKAISAPVTPFNPTPDRLNPVHTLPNDIRRNITATCRVLPGPKQAIRDTSPTEIIREPSLEENNQNLNQLIKELDEYKSRGDNCLEKKKYKEAIEEYSRCIELAITQGGVLGSNYLGDNHVYIQRAEAYFELGLYHDVIVDSVKARELNKNCAQIFHRQGLAQFHLGSQGDALAILSFGLSVDPTSSCLLESLVNCALKSNLKLNFESKYSQIKAAGTDKRPFVVVSVVGQELLALEQMGPAVIVLESAIKIRTDNKRLLGSVLSSLSFAKFKMSEYDSAIKYMLKDLHIENELEDIHGQCRALSNLGFTYYKIGDYDKSLEMHRKHLKLAMCSQMFQEASMGLNAIGHVHVAKKNFESALTSHTRCLEILKQLGNNELDQFKELLSIGYIHSMLNDYNQAEERYMDGVNLLKHSYNTQKLRTEEYTIGMVLVNFNLAELAMKKHSLPSPREYYMKVIKFAEGLSDPEKTIYRQRAMSCDRRLNALQR